VIGAWLDDHPNQVLVAFDALQKVRQASTGKRGQSDVGDLHELSPGPVR
jgi:hypothetical protein